MTTCNHDNGRAWEAIDTNVWLDQYHAQQTTEDGVVDEHISVNVQWSMECIICGHEFAIDRIIKILPQEISRCP